LNPVKTSIQHYQSVWYSFLVLPVYGLQTLNLAPISELKRSIFYPFFSYLCFFLSDAQKSRDQPLAAAAGVKQMSNEQCFVLTDASPTEVELPVWTQVEEILQQTDEILLELSIYRGATIQIRDVSHLHSLCTFSSTA